MPADFEEEGKIIVQIKYASVFTNHAA